MSESHLGTYEHIRIESYRCHRPATATENVIRFEKCAYDSSTGSGNLRRSLLTLGFLGPTRACIALTLAFSRGLVCSRGCGV